MLTNLLLSFREGLEAALVIAIILSYLFQTGRKNMVKSVYLGTLIGILTSILGGYLSFREVQKLGETFQEIFEGLMMLVASGLIAYFIVWMGNQSGKISANIKNKINRTTNLIGLFVLSFLSVFREGMELIIFSLTKISQNASYIALGSGIGIFLAVLLTYVIFKTSLKFNLKLIFKVLGLILIYIGAEMFAEGILKIVESEEEILEIILMLAFIIPSLYFFLRNDIKKNRMIIH